MTRPSLWRILHFWQSCHTYPIALFLNHSRVFFSSPNFLKKKQEINLEFGMLPCFHFHLSFSFLNLSTRISLHGLFLNSKLWTLCVFARLRISSCDIFSGNDDLGVVGILVFKSRFFSVLHFLCNQANGKEIQASNLIRWGCSTSKLSMFYSDFRKCFQFL